ncbi:PP2C family protein-serine/threonine phosphatase [Mucilaginibacter boryungensis]|uniref:Serine/threonine-protein phosphatase n=1 Tax=Mucilaginibacter boryungensis TaxID=768480 RepID=A0ABR9XMW5_9SPHI|nr:PP2C family serine/threonine-protein phosphatase [Mucilaginibacter boryungensis]MBE9668723.1 serine/threonine-protein phosphatase [Mucilaginibacter boryungensis]
MQDSHYIFTEIGPRLENQDAVHVGIKAQYLIACLADGVGGENCGSIASTQSIQYFIEMVNPKEERLDVTIQEVHNEIVLLQAKDPRCKGMASTFTACVIDGMKLVGCQVGDTRLCVLRGNGIKQLTELHTEANRLYKSGQLTKEAYANYPRKNIIESAIGMKTVPKVQIFEFELHPKDRLLLTSDGIHDLVTKREFRDLSLKSETIESFGENIKGCLKNKVLQDNASFIVIGI